MNSVSIGVISDFASDYYHAVMKGQILKHTDSVNFVDIPIHQKYNTISTAWTILNSYEYFPEQTIFLTVVDPGVGTSRLAIAGEVGNKYYVGPDNGIITPSIEKYGGKIYELEIPEQSSNTFHGRDVFAPAAGQLSKSILKNEDEIALFDNGIEPVELGVDISLQDTKGIVTYIDNFGNIVTNIRGEDKSDTINLQVNDQSLEINIYPSFQAGDKEDQVFGIIGSCGTLELVNNRVSAINEIDAEIGSEVKLF